MFPGITIAIPMSHPKPEYLSRLDVCLQSIGNQSCGRSMVDVVIGMVAPHKDVDGIALGQLGRLGLLAIKHGATVAFGEHKGREWEPALTRNIPARWSRRKYVTFVDVDAVLHPEYLEAAFEVLEDEGGALTVKTKMTQYPWGSPEYLIREPGEFEAALDRAPGKEAPGTGCGTITTTAMLEELGGLDERFVGYGPTDWDFTARLKAHGVKIHDLTALTSIALMHQHHDRPFQEANTEELMNRRQTLRTMMKEALEAGELVRNKDGWGGLPWE